MVAKGRAAKNNAAGRFEPYARVGVEDGWHPPDPQILRTQVQVEAPRSALTRNTSPDLPFDRSLNPYRGCEHGCIYCFARPSHAYLGLSAGLDFETRLIARPGMAEVLDRELRRKAYQPAPIAIGTNTDPYQPIERDLELMREILTVLSAHHHPVAIVTKGALIERDIDILAPMAAQGLAKVGVSVTTLDDELSRKMEPRAPAPKRRLAAIRRLSQSGIPVRVMCAPMIPALNDHEMEAILTAGHDAGACSASYIALRLPREVSGLFQDWVTEAYPDRAARIMGHVRDMHGGKEYDAQWGQRMTGTGPYAELLKTRFMVTSRRLGLTHKMASLRTDLFQPPPRTGDQLALF